MPKYNKENFFLEVDEITFKQCNECNNEIDNVELDVCEYCNSEDITTETEHESYICDKCGGTFEMFEDCYVNSKTNIVLCEKCFSEI